MAMGCWSHSSGEMKLICSQQLQLNCVSRTLHLGTCVVLHSRWSQSHNYIGAWHDTSIVITVGRHGIGISVWHATQRRATHATTAVVINEAEPVLSYSARTRPSLAVRGWNWLTGNYTDTQRRISRDRWRHLYNKLLKPNSITLSSSRAGSKQVWSWSNMYATSFEPASNLSATRIA